MVGSNHEQVEDAVVKRAGQLVMTGDVMAEAAVTRGGFMWGKGNSEKQSYLPNNRSRAGRQFVSRKRAPCDAMAGSLRIVGGPRS